MTIVPMKAMISPASEGTMTHEVSRSGLNSTSGFNGASEVESAAVAACAVTSDEPSMRALGSAGSAMMTMSTLPLRRRDSAVSRVASGSTRSVEIRSGSTSATSAAAEP